MLLAGASSALTIPSGTNINGNIDNTSGGVNQVVANFAGASTVSGTKVRGNFAAIIEMGVGFEFEQTGRENIKILMLYNNMLSKYSKKLEQEIIEFSELGDKIDLPVKNYSSGMVSRLAFSVSIFQDSDILLLDEVFAAGDSHFIEKSTNFMKDKLKNVPILILVSHQDNIIKENCDRCVLLKNGSIIADGKPDEILKIYNNWNY